MERNRIKRKQGFVNGITIFLCTVMLFVGIFNMNMTSIHSEAAGISLNYTKVTLDKGQQIQLQMKGTSKKVKWASSNKAVATVGSTGLVTAKKSGRATITARMGRKNYRCRISVTKQEHLYIPSNAVMNGKNIYLAVGCDGGGPLYVYNTSNKSRKQLSKDKCSELSVKGRYVYCTVNKYNGSDARNRYIYRIAKNGKTSKKLADGYNPVVIGKYIYYVAVKKEYADWTDSYIDGRSIGIYRMNLDGSNKKFLCNMSGQLIAGNNRLIVYSSSNAYSISLNGKRIKRIRLSKSVFNTNTTSERIDISWVDGGDLDDVGICANARGNVYTCSTNTIYRQQGSNRKKIYSFDSNATIGKLIDCNEYLVAIVSKHVGIHVYVITRNGRSIKEVYSFLGAGGDWR